MSKNARRVFMEVLENGIKKMFCFDSLGSALRFKELVRVYAEETSAGNGYHGYWPVDGLLLNSEVETIPGHCITRLKYDYVLNMLHAIVAARLVREYLGEYMNDQVPDGERLDVDFCVGRRDKAIYFYLDRLPERQRPAVGDKFRSIPSRGGIWGLEGIVVTDLGGELEVIARQDCDDKTGVPKEGVEVRRVSADTVMKIKK